MKFYSVRMDFKLNQIDQKNNIDACKCKEKKKTQEEIKCTSEKLDAQYIQLLVHPSTL